MFVMFGFGIIGFIDDYRKVKKQHEDGLSSKMRLLGEFIIAFVACYFIAQWQNSTSTESPVSYTHLDVYKRQALFYAKIQCLALKIWVLMRAAAPI